MTEHDPMCPQYDQTVHTIAMFDTPCRCEEYARVRSNERSKSDMGLLGNNIDLRAEVDRLTIEIRKVVDSRERLRVEMEQKVIDANREVALARAEVAALARWKAEATAVIEAWERVHALLGKPGFIGESKAVVTYDEVRDLLEDRAAARHRQIAVPWQHILDASAVANAARREVLADLRAKVEGLPYRTWVPPHATDCPGRPGKRGICTCGDSLRASDWMLRADVLALIEEAGRG
jgi:hypothetical protein